MKKVKIKPGDRSLLIIESALIFGMTTLSGGFYLAGDLSKRFSKLGYKIGAQLDSLSLDLIEYTAQSLEKCVWMEMEDDG